MQNKIDFKTRNITKDKEYCFTMMKRQIYQNDITNTNKNVPKNRAQNTQKI